MYLPHLAGASGRRRPGSPCGPLRLAIPPRLPHKPGAPPTGGRSLSDAGVAQG